MEEKQAHLIFDIPETFAGRMIESFLKNELQLSRQRIRALKKTKGVYLDGIPVFVTMRFKGGEKLTIWFETLKQEIPPEAIPLSIIYEDPDLIVVDKPAGMVVHPVSHFSPALWQMP